MADAANSFLLSRLPPIVWPILIVVLNVLVGVMFVRDLGRLRRKEPIKFWFLAPVYPGDALRPLAIVKAFGLYGVFFGIELLMVGAVAFVAFRA